MKTRPTRTPNTSLLNRTLLLATLPVLRPRNQELPTAICHRINGLHTARPNNSIWHPVQMPRTMPRRKHQWVLLEIRTWQVWPLR